MFLYHVPHTFGGKDTPFTNALWAIVLLAGAVAVFWVLTGSEAARTVTLVIPGEKTVVVDGQTLNPSRLPQSEDEGDMYHVQLSPGTHEVEVRDGTGSEIHEITVQDRDGQIFHMVDGELRDMLSPGARMDN